MTEEVVGVLASHQGSLQPLHLACDVDTVLLGPKGESKYLGTLEGGEAGRQGSISARPQGPARRSAPGLAQQCWCEHTGYHNTWGVGDLRVMPIACLPSLQSNSHIHDHCDGRLLSVNLLD